MTTHPAMTADELRRRFPNAPESFIERNAAPGSEPPPGFGDVSDDEPRWIGTSLAVPRGVGVLPQTRRLARPRRPRGPNGTEARFLRECRAGLPAVYEGLRFKLPGKDGRHYTPDFVIGRGTDRPLECVEVKRRFKGGARLLSYRDARGRFDTAREAWPQFTWTWAELQESGTWRIE